MKNKKKGKKQKRTKKTRAQIDERVQKCVKKKLNNCAEQQFGSEIKQKKKPKTKHSSKQKGYFTKGNNEKLLATRSKLGKEAHKQAAILGITRIAVRTNK